MRIFVLKKEHLLVMIYILIICAIFSSARNQYISTASMPTSKKTVLIDPGHGGDDPGAIAGKISEKNINLEIAKKLQEYLEQGDAYVLMTRTEDKALSSNKQSDMYRRKTIANSSNADIYVSIHQNIYSNSNVKGAQVFYFKKSENSKRLAECIQSEIKSLSPSNKMKPSPNTSYFVLRQTVMPSVIVECGFLSNPGERWRLTTEEYQDQIAWAIYKGIIKYFNQEDTETLD